MTSETPSARSGARLRARSKKLSWLLRHGAVEAGVAMDAAGWVAVEDALRVVGLDRDALDEVVRENDKRRLELDREADRIRACQGHSTGLPVTREALEASWVPYAGPAPVWHGTFLEAVTSIAREGITAQARTHVHLAPGTASVVGKRANVHVLLEVCPRRMADAGEALHVAPNGVVLARRVPAGCVAGLRALTRRARAREDALRALFTLPSR
ncbi:MAG: RNA 2'-phosphotransferase [Sandaracinus sp.]|nr:RNA 2'-phosphotransferase [Myxococcales bacterium]MAT29474.1 RNA 2'-phosphotransferase [Sandaracinus sp.]MBJ70648.1 RNA 2'-phosphotransferase [Sandaracinus sp.]